MAEPWLRFPVVCPQCGAEALFNLPIATIAAALVEGAPIELRVSCHDLRWNADPIEVGQLREYLASVEGISAQRVPSLSSPPEVNPFTR
jgi:hypothetical protein